MANSNPTEDPVTALIDRLRARADNAYHQYIGQSGVAECLGWEVKVEKGEFGWAELEAHTKRGELLGRHRALHEAATLIEEELKRG